MFLAQFRQLCNVHLAEGVEPGFLQGMAAARASVAE